MNSESVSYGFPFVIRCVLPIHTTVPHCDRILRHSGFHLQNKAKSNIQYHPGNFVWLLLRVVAGLSSPIDAICVFLSLHSSESNVLCSCRKTRT